MSSKADYDIGNAPLPDVDEAGDELFWILTQVLQKQKVAYADYQEAKREFEMDEDDEDESPVEPIPVRTPGGLIFGMLLDLCARMAIEINGVDRTTTVRLELLHADGDRKITLSVPDYAAMREGGQPYSPSADALVDLQS